MIDILLVDDHDVVRAGLRAVLEATGDFTIVDDVANVNDALGVCRKSAPQVVLMDLSIPGRDGIDGTREILKLSPNSRIVILTAFSDDQSVVSAIRAGARGFVLKRATSDRLFEAVKTVAAGGVYLSPEVSHCLFDSLQPGKEPTQGGMLQVLTHRELQVLRLIAEGNTSKEIAAMMTLSPETVRSYRKSVMKKLRVHNVAALTQIAINEGVVRQLTAGDAAPRVG